MKSRFLISLFLPCALLISSACQSEAAAVLDAPASAPPAEDAKVIDAEPFSEPDPQPAPTLDAIGVRTFAPVFEDADRAQPPLVVTRKLGWYAHAAGLAWAAFDVEWLNSDLMLHHWPVRVRLPLRPDPAFLESAAGPVNLRRSTLAVFVRLTDMQEADPPSDVSVGLDTVSGAAVLVARETHAASDPVVLTYGGDVQRAVFQLVYPTTGELLYPELM